VAAKFSDLSDINSHMTIKKGLCIFCGSPFTSDNPRAKEDVFPKWFQKYTRSQKTPVFIHIGDGTPVRSLVFSELFAGQVCHACNSKWMSRLEDRMKPHLIPLIDGQEKRALDWRTCQWIAAWVFKTSLMLHSASTLPQVIPIEHYQTIHQVRAIPRCVVVSIAPINNPEANFWIQSRAWSTNLQVPLSNDEKNLLTREGYRICMRFGHLATRVIYLPLNDLSFMDANDAISLVRPVSRKGVNWNLQNQIEHLKEMDESLFLVDGIQRLRKQPLSF
jgi:hypothetical protein